MQESDIQYIARKLPLELLEADRERSYELNKTLLSTCNLNESQENIEFLITTIQMLRLIETDCINQTGGLIMKKTLLAFLLFGVVALGIMAYGKTDKSTTINVTLK